MITDDDVLYQDEKVCILKPRAKKGVLVWHKFQETQGIDIDIPSIGLKSGLQMHKEGYDFGRSRFHPYIFFRAPFYNNKIDYTSFESEILSSYEDWVLKEDRIMFIRVDPRRTRVYSSEIRASKNPGEWKKSEKWMTKYFSVLWSNDKDLKELQKPGQVPYWNLFSSEMRLHNSRETMNYPWDSYPIHRCSEVLVELPHMQTHYFVKREN